MYSVQQGVWARTTEFIGRDEIGSVYLPTQLEPTLQLSARDNAKSVGSVDF